ncbi:hypothetical protein Tco_0096189 [Tanacetum coccineum]
MPTHKAKKKGQAPDRNKAIQEEVTNGKETRWQLEDVCGLYRLKQNKYEAQSQKVHLQCERGNVPGSRGQHERNQGMPRESKSGDKATISQDAEKGAKP